MPKETARSLEGCLMTILHHCDYTKFFAQLTSADRKRVLGIEDGLKNVKQQVEKMEVAAKVGDLERIRQILAEPVTFGAD